LDKALEPDFLSGENSEQVKETLQLALRPSVVKRALKYAVIVGCILIAINHSDAILSGNIPAARWFRMALTVVVPYVVSTLSSVGAMRERLAHAK
jgi:hypothetical protein